MDMSAEVAGVDAFSWEIDEELSDEEDQLLLQWLRQRRSSPFRASIATAPTSPAAPSASLLDVAEFFAPEKIGAALARLSSECCPITLEPMESPVLVADGFIYEETAIMRWLEEGGDHGAKSPCTNLPLQHRMALKLEPFRKAMEHCLRNKQHLSALDDEASQCAAALEAWSLQDGGEVDALVLKRLEASISHASALLSSLQARESDLEDVGKSLRNFSYTESVAVEMTVAAVRIQRCFRRHMRRSLKREKRRRLTHGRRHVVAAAAVGASIGSHAGPRTPKNAALRGLLRIWAQRERRVNLVFDA